MLASWRHMPAVISYVVHVSTLVYKQAILHAFNFDCSRLITWQNMCKNSSNVESIQVKTGITNVVLYSLLALLFLKERKLRFWLLFSCIIAVWNLSLGWKVASMPRSCFVAHGWWFAGEHQTGNSNATFTIACWEHIASCHALYLPGPGVMALLMRTKGA